MNFLASNRRLVIAHNPHSSRAAAIQELVFDRLDAAGYVYESLEVKQASLQDNVARLAPRILPDDIILSAAGDGSAHAVFHSVLAANQPGVELGFLAYGNFNDIPHVFNTKATQRDPLAFLQQASPETVWPLDIVVDNSPLRSALLYATIGWTAKAAHQFDDPTVRQKITHGSAGVFKSLSRTGWYYLRTRHSSLLSSFRYNGKVYKKTDLIFANSPTVARLFHTSKRYYQQEVFLFRMLDVRSLVKNIPFLISGLIGRMKGSEETNVALDFEVPSSVPVQCDGEVVELENVTRIEVRKASAPLVILRTK